MALHRALPPTNGRPGFPFGFLGAGGRLPKERRGLVFIAKCHYVSCTQVPDAGCGVLGAASAREKEYTSTRSQTQHNRNVLPLVVRHHAQHHRTTPESTYGTEHAMAPPHARWICSAVRNPPPFPNAHVQCTWGWGVSSVSGCRALSQRSVCIVRVSASCAHAVSARPERCQSLARRSAAHDTGALITTARRAAP